MKKTKVESTADDKTSKWIRSTNLLLLMPSRSFFGPFIHRYVASADCHWAFACRDNLVLDLMESSITGADARESWNNQLASYILPFRTWDLLCSCLAMLCP